MKFKNIKRILFFSLFILFSATLLQAQQQTELSIDSSRIEYQGKVLETAFGTEKKWRVTGAVSSITGEELSKMTSANFLNTLMARIPGLTVITGSGEPGYDNPTLVLRGLSNFDYGNNENKMLVYLDRFEVDLGTIATLSADEVETVTVLKDAASLAVYGLRGGNGAILITTKKGTNNRKPIITFNSHYGFQSAIQLPKAVNAYDYTRLYNQARQNDGLPIKYSNPEFYKGTNDPLHPNVNWYNEVLNSSAPIQNYDISFRGGDKIAKYFILLGYDNVSGLYKNANVIGKDFGTNSEYSKYNVRSNIELHLSNNFSIAAELTGKIEDRNSPAAFGGGDFFNRLLNTPASAFAVKNQNGTWGSTAVYNFNPVEKLTQGGVYNAHTRTLQTNLSFVEKLNMITEGLSLSGGISFNNQSIGTYSKWFNVPTYEISKDATDNAILNPDGTPIYIQHGVVGQGINDGEASHFSRRTFRFSLNYIRSFGKHSFTGLLSAESEEYSFSGLTYPFRYEGFSANITYDYAKKYILDLSSGYNGTGDYAKGHRFGLFPAVGVSWILSNEKFMSDLKWINYLKIKGSYGLTGSVNNNYRFIYDHWATNSGIGGWYVGSGNSYQGGWAEGRIGNPDASWEKKSIFNLGLEATILNNLAVSLDIFKEERTGIYQTASDIPAFTGFQLPYVNSGKVSNQGFEVSLKYDGKISSDFKYSIGLSGSFARNKIENINETVQPYSYLYQTGYSISQYRGLKWTGYYQVSDFDANGNLNNGNVKSSYSNVKPGDLKYKDQNGDGIINAYDFVPMKYSWFPEWTFGLNLGFQYKSFDMNMFFQGVTNRSVVLPDSYINPLVNNNNITPFSLNSWTPATATTATSPRLTTQSNSNNTQSSDFSMRDGSFVKLRNVEFGYIIPKMSFLNEIDDIRIFVNGTNLVTWDKIKDLEAENLSMGYPLIKSISIGLKAKF